METNVTRPNESTAAARPETTSTRRVLVPAVDIYENEGELVLLADLPGVAPDAVRVNVEAERLALEADRELRGARVQYKRVFTVAPIFDTEKVTARMARGVLHLTLPKLAAIKPRQIPVTSG